MSKYSERFLTKKCMLTNTFNKILKKCASLQKNNLTLNTINQKITIKTRNIMRIIYNFDYNS